MLAAEPNTGKTRTQQVTGTLTSKGTKHLVTITVDTDGAKGTQTGTLTATDNHPFWLPREHRWAEAGELKPGTWLRTSTGTWVQVTAIKAWTAHAQRVHNLTVTGDHTYHVKTGDTSVLVHNEDLNRDPLDEIAACPVARNTHFANMTVLDDRGNIISQDVLRSDA